MNSEAIRLQVRIAELEQLLPQIERLLAQGQRYMQLVKVSNNTRNDRH